MKEIFSEWIVNIGFFSVVTSLTMKFLPGKVYVPYVKLFTGIVMILIFLNPLLKLLDIEEKMADDLAEEVFRVEMMQVETELFQLEEKQKKEIEERYKKIWEEQDD